MPFNGRFTPTTSSSLDLRDVKPLPDVRTHGVMDQFDSDPSPSPLPSEDSELSLLLESLSLLCEADAMLMESSSQVTSEVTSELISLIQHYKKPMGAVIVHALEKPEELVPWTLCPTLINHLNALSSHSYSRRMNMSVRNIVGRAKGSLDRERERREAYQAKVSLRIVTELARMCRRRDLHCVPPITMMKSIDNILVRLNHRHWKRSCRELDVVYKSTVEQAVMSVCRWRPQPIFPSPTDVVSTRYGLGVYDNLEFRLPVAEPRIKDGEMLFTTLLHTVTCKFTVFISHVHVR